MSIEQVMKTRVISVEMDDTLGQVHTLMQQAKVHHLPVIKDKKLVGFVSDGDLKNATSPFVGTAAESNKDIATFDKRVHQVMTRKLIVANKNTSTKAAARLILENKISALPVVDDEYQLIGIITWRDILKLAVDYSPNKKT